MLVKSINPLSEEVIAEYAMHSEEQLMEFIENLHKGYKSWRAFSLQERLSFLPLLKQSLKEYAAVRSL